MDKKFAEQYKKISDELEDKMDNKFDEQNDTVKFQLLNLLIFYHRHT